jgi:predicted metal-binding membrane protein
VTPTSRSAAMTSTRAAVWTLGLAAVCWVFVVRQMSGMDMGTETELGSFGFFAAVWVSMMAAMMLPGAVPAVARVGRGLAAPLFAASYVAVWALFGLAVYALYRPHGTVAAGVLTIAAGLYELTPLKRECRRRCQRDVRSGFQFGIFCVGSSIGLMVMLIALGVMSVAWMASVAVLVLAQKLLPPRARIDVPVALAITTLGMVMLI